MSQINAFKLLYVLMVIPNNLLNMIMLIHLLIICVIHLFISGGESIYGGTFADEFHSRLRFNHRGLVACANSNAPNTNGSQFFITLDRCDWLDKKHTIFGKVTRSSLMYNILPASLNIDEFYLVYRLPVIRCIIC